MKLHSALTKTERELRGWRVKKAERGGERRGVRNVKKVEGGRNRGDERSDKK